MSTSELIRQIFTDIVTSEMTYTIFLIMVILLFFITMIDSIIVQDIIYTNAQFSLKYGRLVILNSIYLVLIIYIKTFVSICMYANETIFFYRIKHPKIDYLTIPTFITSDIALAFAIINVISIYFIKQTFEK